MNLNIFLEKRSSTSTSCRNQWTGPDRFCLSCELNQKAYWPSLWHLMRCQYEEKSCRAFTSVVLPAEAISGYLHATINRGFWREGHLAVAGTQPVLHKSAVLLVRNFVRMRLQEGRADVAQMTGFIGEAYPHEAHVFGVHILDRLRRWMNSGAPVTAVISPWAGSSRARISHRIV